MNLWSRRALALFTLGGLLWFGSVSCGEVLPSGSVASGSRTSPSPTPVVSPVQSGYSIYSNTFDHYSVAYPAGWYILPSMAAGNAVSISNKPFDPNTMYPNRWKLDIVIAANPQSLTAKQWADKDMTDHSQTILSEVSVMIGGELGIDRHLSQDGSTAFGFWATHGPRMVLMDATDQPDFQPIVADIIGSMAFTA